MENLGNMLNTNILNIVMKEYSMSEEQNVTKEEIAIEPEVNSDDKSENKALTTTPQKTKKHLEAKKLVQEAKSIAKTSQSEVHDCELVLDGNMREYKESKEALSKGVIKDAKALLFELGYTKTSNEKMEEDAVVFKANKDVKPIILKDVHSGKFTGLILSLFGGFITFVGLIYLATEKLSMTLYVDKVPSGETTHSIFAWFGTLFGREDDAINGGIFVGIIVLLVVTLIYVLRVSLKGGSNLRFATKQMKETQKYITYNSNCKIEMDRMDGHIIDAIKVLADYGAVLNEQNAKLARIRHFEGKQSSLVGYHDKSVHEMSNTQNIIENISQFMATAMSDDEKLSGKSTLFLHTAKESMQKIVSDFA